MKQQMQNKIRIDTHVATGVTAFFDVLGYKKLLTNNEVEDVNEIIHILHRTCSETLWRLDRCVVDLNPDYLIFSDSVLVYWALETHDSPKSALSHFIGRCGQLTGELLARGLPVRGAIAKGKFSIIEGKSFGGKCIIEAYELAQNLEMAGCAIVPSFESEVFADKSNRKNLVLWPTPLKTTSKPQELLMLDYSPSFEGSKRISRNDVIGCFGAFKKDVSAEVYPKINNTLRFLKDCKKQR